MAEIKEKHGGEPLFRITKRTDAKPIFHVLVSVSAAMIGLIISSIICAIAAEDGTPVMFFSSVFDGVFGTSRSLWNMLRDASLFICVSLALIPAFKMKFWNLGGNGQILIGALAAIFVVDQLGGSIPGGIVYDLNHDAAGNIINDVRVPGWIIHILSILSAVIAGAVWAVIPAVFKALFNTNESLFTLMMNYIASGVVSVYIASRMKNGQTTFPTLEEGRIPEMGNPYLPVILIAVVLTVLMTIYLRYGKHGYELTVVGESRNTAKYIGINVKKVIIRTLVLSGALCGFVGGLLIGFFSPTIGVNTANNMGFTAIMTSWLAAFNPLVIMVTCLFVSFITVGMSGVQMDMGFTNSSIINLVVGLIYFFVIGAEFFVQYKLVFRRKKEKKQ